MTDGLQPPQIDLRSGSVFALVRQQQSQLAALQSRCAALQDAHEVLCDCLAASGTLTKERLHARLHRRKFEMTLRQHPYQRSAEDLESLTHVKDLMLSISLFVGLQGLAAMAGASRRSQREVRSVFSEVLESFPVSLYAAGGEAGGVALASVERFRAADGCWSACAPLQTARSGCAAVALCGRIHVLGGCSADGEDLRSVERLDPCTGEWEMMPPMLAGRDELAATAHEGHMYAVGGSHLVWPMRHVTNTVEQFSVLETAEGQGGWSYLPLLDMQRYGAAAVVVEDSMVVLGGCCDDGGTALDSVERLRLEPPDVWRPMPPMLRPRCNFAAAVVGGCIYISGGYDDRMRDLDSVERLDVQDPRAGWQLVASLTIPRWGVRAVAKRGAMFIVGGNSGFKEVDAVDHWNGTSGAWECLTGLQVPRRSFGLAVSCKA
eukprot:TRINITY_DN15500_c0_g1_i1.p1 TRINITY_DN15500_c0_g1~~TRINITY_DN15500_c0_g1_i1.p1  ORF type:complete len:434 (+),score=91.06 TRINITY_DN15500_c0_g1_i1:136-1437(+)